jgi:hypothetical protein
VWWTLSVVFMALSSLVVCSNCSVCWAAWASWSPSSESG